MKILIVEDEPSLREIMYRALVQEHYVVETAATYAEADAKVAGYSYDCILLDIMLPDGNGLRLLEHIKELRKRENVIIISARNSLEDKVLGLEQGADDYLPKPFSHAQLTARVKSLLRRYRVYQGKSEPEEDEWLVRGPLRINRTYNEVEKNGQPIDLPELEYQMLLLMASHAGRIFSAQNLYESVWNEPYLYSSNGTVMVHIRKLRVKLEDDPQNPKLIQTVWGKGYRFG